MPSKNKVADEKFRLVFWPEFWILYQRKMKYSVLSADGSFFAVFQLIHSEFWKQNLTKVPQEFQPEFWPKVAKLAGFMTGYLNSSRNTLLKKNKVQRAVFLLFHSEFWKQHRNFSSIPVIKAVCQLIFRQN